MKKIILTFGTIAGLVCIALMYIKMPRDGQFNFEDSSQIWGYGSMIIALSTIFFAVKQYRDKYGGGTIKFGKAFMIGLGISLIATLIYIITWEIYMHNVAPDFFDQYIAYMQETKVSSGLSPAEVNAEMAPMIGLMESCKENALIRMGMTSIEILPVGLLLSLISALVFGVFLKKKEPVLA